MDPRIKRATDFLQMLRILILKRKNILKIFNVEIIIFIIAEKKQFLCNYRTLLYL